MKTATFLATLRTHAALPLVFRAGSDLVTPGYHLTEVKRVAYDTMDCGALTHRWAETQFEIWAPAQREDGRADYMAAGKFLRIVDRVEKDLPLTGDAPARIHTDFAGGPAALYDISSLTVADGQLIVELAADRTRCKARERALAANQALDCGEGGSCSTAAPAPAEAAAGCGCGATPSAERHVAAGCCT